MAVAVLTAISSYYLLFRALGPVNVWYSRRFVEQTELDPLYPPLMWMDATVLPLLASAVGGLASGLIFRNRSRGLTACTGSALVVTYFWFWHRAATVEAALYAVGIGGGVLAALTTYWVQKKRDDSSAARNR